uniref:Fe2OG dioxygenase domain-containing protein n=1 Tax=Arion vulgaris TaxID=1028688 RepID=A0A0B6ZL00_9EUPU
MQKMQQTPLQEYICACFLKRNIFVKKYKTHVTFENEKQFQQEYRQHLRMKGCTTDKQYSDVLSEVKKETERRRSFHSLSLTNYQHFQSKYEKLHPEIWKLIPSFLDPRFVTITKDAQQMSGDSLLLSLVQNGGYIAESAVYRLPVFTKEFCQQLVEEIKHFDKFPGKKSQPNTMNSYGVSLDEMGLSDHLITPLITEWLQTLTRGLFHKWGGGTIDSFKAFIVRYDETGDKDLSLHYDNAEVTINIGLNSDYEGGDLQFGGIWGEEDTTQNMIVMSHEIGHGILHCARQLHSALPITSGQRYNLVIWMRSSSIRNHMCPMCGETPSLVAVPFAGEGFIVPSTPHWLCSYL